MCDLQESFQPEAVGSAAKARTIEGIAYRENGLGDVNFFRVG